MRIVLAALALAASIFLVGCEDKFTQENFDKIANGMTLDQVEAILGEGTKEESGGFSVSGAGISQSQGEKYSKSRVYSWKDGGKLIVVTLTEDKVTSKTKSGF
ncbi:MAG: hypothetical protein JNM80_14555 [Phycisphaerae bacterium]|nr:hypothetical protein [Phycisphaerae bacterium]